VGIIQRQSIKGTVIIYGGTIIGFITSSLIFPNVLSSEEIGLIGILVAYAMIFSRFASLGFNAIGNRLFPYFRDKEKGHHGFLFMALTTSLIGFLLSYVVFVIIKPYLLESGTEKTMLLADNIGFVVPLIFSILFFTILDTYYRLLFNAVIGTFLKEFLQRFLILVFIIAYYYTAVTFNGFLILYVSAFFIPLVIITLSLISQRQFMIRPDMDFLNKKFVKSMVNVGLFGILVSFSGTVILNIDRIMLKEFLGLSGTGIYMTTFYFGVLVGIPARPLLKISSTLIAEAWKKDDRKTINEVYEKSSLNQFIVGMILFLGIWLNEDNIFRVLPAEYAAGRYVILFIGITYLFEMLCGASTAIISTSKYYKYQAYFMLLLIVLVIASNFAFIPLWGIVGAAVASLSSKLIVFILRYIFLLKKFKFQPYNTKFLLVVLIGGITYACGYFMPSFDNLILSLVLKSAVIATVFFILLLILKPSEDIHRIIMNTLSLVRKGR